MLTGLITGLLAAATGATAPVVAPPVLRTWPHDVTSYTEGLVWDRGRLFESAGLYGQSDVREVQPRTGRVLHRHRLAARFFGEGLTTVGPRLVQLTWREHQGMVWTKDGLRRVGGFRFTGEGWGIARLGDRLVMSDGTAMLRFLDPTTFRVTRRLGVTDGGRPVPMLNELEVVRGEVWANVYQTNDVVIIDPATGRVRLRLDLTGLWRWVPPGMTVDVLNGIAWDRANDRVLLTGKLWPRVFEVSSRPG